MASFVPMFTIYVYVYSQAPAIRYRANANLHGHSETLYDCDRYFVCLYDRVSEMILALASFSGLVSFVLQTTGFPRNGKYIVNCNVSR